MQAAVERGLGDGERPNGAALDATLDPREDGKDGESPLPEDSSACYDKHSGTRRKGGPVLDLLVIITL